MNEKRLDEISIDGKHLFEWKNADGICLESTIDHLGPTEAKELLRLARLGLKHNDTIEQCAKVCDRFTNETMFFDELKIDREEYLSDKCAVEIRKLKPASREEKEK